MLWFVLFVRSTTSLALNYRCVRERPQWQLPDLPCFMWGQEKGEDKSVCPEHLDAAVTSKWPRNCSKETSVSNVLTHRLYRTEHELRSLSSQGDLVLQCDHLFEALTKLSVIVSNQNFIRVVQGRYETPSLCLKTALYWDNILYVLSLDGTSGGSLCLLQRLAPWISQMWKE